MLEHKPTSQPLWTLQVLTPDYQVDGFCDINCFTPYTFCSANYQIALPTDALQLCQVHITPVSGLQTPHELDVPNWNITFYNGFIAVIPRDKPSLQYFHDNLSHYPLYPVDVYAGPYIFHGDLPIEKKEFKKLEFLYSYILKDVTIDCLAPQSPLKSYQVPFAMVRTLLVEGMVMKG